MRIYRPHRGNFDAWRRYTVQVDGKEEHRIADGEFLELPGNRHHLSVTVGGYCSGDILVEVHSGEVVICELAANPETDDPAVRVVVVSEATWQQRLLRFDRPPYVGGRSLGLVSAIAASVIAMGFAVVTLIVCIRLLIHLANPNNAIGFVFVVLVGTLVWLAFGFIGASGLRSLYYYFRLPPDYRH